MSTPNTVYRGSRLLWRAGSYRGIGVRVWADGEPLRLPSDLAVSGFEWGYAGIGPKQLALALILHATGNRTLAIDSYIWFMWAKVSCWGREWSITAAEVRSWVEQCQRETAAEEAAAAAEEADVPLACERVRRCQVCGCTNDDCRQCIRATGLPCHWIGEEDLCSRCADEDHLSTREVEGGAA